VEHELFHRVTKMILAQGNDLAQAFLFDRSHKAFGVRIGWRRLSNCLTAILAATSMTDRKFDSA